MGAVLGSLIMYIPGVLNIGYIQQVETISPLPRCDRCTVLDWIQHIHLSPASGLEAVIHVCAQLATL